MNDLRRKKSGKTLKNSDKISGASQVPSRSSFKDEFYHKIDPGGIDLRENFLEIDCFNNVDVKYQTYFFFKNKSGGMSGYLEDSSEVSYTRDEVAKSIADLVRTVETTPQMRRFWQLNKETVKDCETQIKEAVDKSKDLLVRDNQKKLRNLLRKLIITIVKYSATSLKIKIRIYQHLGIPIDSLGNEDFVSITFDMEKFMESMGPENMEDVLIEFTEGFEEEYPWNLHIKYKQTMQSQKRKVRFNIARKSNDQKCYIVRRVGRSEYKKLDLTDYGYYVEGKKKKKSKGFLNLSSLISKKDDDDDGDDALQRFVLQNSEGKVIVLSFRSGHAVRKCLALFQNSEMKEVKKEPKGLEKLLHAVFPTSFPEDRDRSTAGGGLDIGDSGPSFDIDKVKELFQPYSKSLQGKLRVSFLQFFKTCEGKGKEGTDDILFAHNMFLKRNRLLKIFKGGGEEDDQGEETKAKVKTVLMERIFQPMIAREAFWMKSYVFWSRQEVLEFCKYVFVFVDDCLENYKRLYDCVAAELKRKFKQKLGPFECDLLSTETKLPYKFLLEILEDSDDEDLQLFDNEELVDDFFKHPPNERCLRKFLLNPKMIQNLKSNSELLKELLAIANDETTELEKMQKALRKFYNQFTVIERGVHAEIFSKKLRKLLKKKFTDVEALQDKICKKVTSIRIKLQKDVSDSLNEFCDLEKICRLIAAGARTKNLSGVWTPTSQDIYELTVKVNFTSINRDVDKISKTLWSVVNRIPIVKGEIPPFAFFHLGVSIGNARFDFFDDDRVRVKKAVSGALKASFDADVFYVRGADFIKIARYIFGWNQREYYDNLKNNCQTFVYKFMNFLYINFPHNRTGNSKFDWDFFLTRKNACKEWIDEMKFVRKPERKVRLTKKFVETFQDQIENFNINAGDLFFHDHDQVYQFMCLFSNQRLYDQLREEFPDVLILMKAFCRSYTFERRHREANVRENEKKKKKEEEDDDEEDEDDEDEEEVIKAAFECCYFNLPPKYGREGKNRFKVKLHRPLYK